MSNRFIVRLVILVVIALPVCWTYSGLQEHQHSHQHGGKDGPAKPKPPRIFLDKSPRIVEYQLRRLDNGRLLLVDRRTDHPKYKPVFAAILLRAGMSPQYREEALLGLVKLNKSDATTELLAAMKGLKGADRQQRRTFRALAKMVLGQSAQALAGKTRLLEQATLSENPLLRSVGFAGLVVAGQPQVAWRKARIDNRVVDWLSAVRLVPRQEVRAQLRSSIVSLLGSDKPEPVRRAAISALAEVSARSGETFKVIAPFVSQDKYRIAAVRTLLRVPPAQRDPATCGQLAKVLVAFAEATPAAQRTTNEFIDAMQLADQMLARIPVSVSRSYRQRLRAVTVRVVRIHTVEEEMRYDVPYFAVEAGRPVQIVLQNEDLMPHNLVVTLPGALKEVAMAGAALGPEPGFKGKPFVPKSDKVLFATGMVPSRSQERLTFEAPKQVGEYPFVCTFPRHWMRMYGVMIVVEDLDAWLKDPKKPKDPIGSDRAFVRSWKIDDLKSELQSGLRGRTPQIGQRIFTEATCAQCHKAAGKGGAVGPELTDVFKRWKGDRLAVLREILEPSHRIDPKYAVRQILTDAGKVYTGIVKEETKTTIAILDNPESAKAVLIKKSDIDEMVKTSKSMMPKALLDRFTKDEIFELMAFLESIQSKP